MQEPHFFVDPSDSTMQTATWGQYGFHHIKATGQEFINALLREFESVKYQPTSAMLPRQQASIDNGEAHCFNPFEMYDTEALAEKDPDGFVRYFIPPIDYSKILDKHNIVLEGHRGSGKSMVFRYLSLYHEHVREGNLPFWGFYVKLESGFFDALERTTESDTEWIKIFQHYFNLVVATGLLGNILSAIKNGLITITENDEKEIVARIRNRLLHISAEGFEETLQDLREQMYCQLDIIRDNPQESVFRTSERVIHAFLKEISRSIPKLADKWWAIFLDEWDNLREEQQKVVVRRLHDRSGDMRYKIAVKTLGFIHVDLKGRALDRTHDYQFVCADHYLFDEKAKSQYFKFLERVSNKRLEIARHIDMEIRKLLPKREGKPKLGYDYSGFESFAMLSSGLIREFLELCKDAVYSSQPEIALQPVTLAPIPVKWQNHTAKVHSAIHYNNHRACPESDNVIKLLFVLGSVFRGIDRATQKQREKRRPLSFQISDSYDVDPYSKDIIVQAVRNRLLQMPDIPLQPRNPQEGVKGKYIIHRLLCPSFGLSVYERYSVPISSSTLVTCLGIVDTPRSSIFYRYRRCVYEWSRNFTSEKAV